MREGGVLIGLRVGSTYDNSFAKMSNMMTSDSERGRGEQRRVSAASPRRSIRGYGIEEGRESG